MKRRDFFKNTVKAIGSAYVAPLMPLTLAEGGIVEDNVLASVPHCETVIRFEEYMLTVHEAAKVFNIQPQYLSEYISYHENLYRAYRHNPRIHDDRRSAER